MNSLSASEKGTLFEPKKVKFIQLIFVDINGVPKGMEVPIGRYDEAIEDGIAFDGSSIPGFEGIEDSDLIFKADPSAYAEIPWEGISRVYGYIYKGRKPYPADPRGVLRGALEELEKAGFRAYIGPEPEFYLFKKNGSWELQIPDSGGYFDLVTLDRARELKREIALHMPALGLVPEVLHHEVGKAQHEIDFRYDEALRTADNIVSFKYIVKAISEMHGLYATFMPKPLYGFPGNGMHLHISLWKDGENAFIGDEGLSETALYFVGGILAHAKALTAVTNPTVNSYKRLVPGYEAPVYISWGYRNRSALIRVPAFWGNGARIEYRCPDPSANPYLAFAAILMAGLDGIRRKIEPDAYVEENVYEMGDSKRKSLGIDTLPESLGEALEELKKDGVVREALGGAYRNFIAYKEREWEGYLEYLGAKGLPEDTKKVTEWELERYFHV
ncbi:type I glutamate--ammonia ligase [Thermococcus thioreducens]|uniref:Glutamine synthetase n=1 Tax=Thermococcus thioreducens TaxID=277988 RepID=A0A1I0NW74_9EURY|nr:type I glutamate--ammonia ligase [Thermococcus thioreducens]ASJ11520.1 glutamine synthetase [Thermococcus thioreducens]SEW05230.1 L-glutamine synthetase [Thermococcus thioreducens]